MFVEKIDLRGTHQRAGNVGGGGVEKERAVFLDTPPIAIIAEEMSRLTVLGIATGIRSRRAHVLFDPPAQGFNPFRRQGAPQEDRAILMKRGDCLIVQ